MISSRVERISALDLPRMIHYVIIGRDEALNSLAGSFQRDGSCRGDALKELGGPGGVTQHCGIGSRVESVTPNEQIKKCNRWESPPEPGTVKANAGPNHQCRNDTKPKKML